VGVQDAGREAVRPRTAEAVRLGPGRPPGHGQRAPSGDAPATPILFLLGRGQLARDFTPSLPGAVAAPPPDSVALALVPKTPVPDYDRLTLVVDRATLGLRMLIARDGQGGTSTFVFSKLRRTSACRYAQFASRFPKGADVVTRSDARVRRVVARRARRCCWPPSPAAASTGSLRAASRAERVEDFDRAVVEYEKALRAKPRRPLPPLSLQRAKLRAAAFHDRARRHLAGTGKLEEALIELPDRRRAEPGQRRHRSALARLRGQLRAKLAVPTDGKTRLQRSSRRRRPAAGRLELPRA
jgi:hypothetical protein